MPATVVNAASATSANDKPGGVAPKRTVGSKRGHIKMEVEREEVTRDDDGEENKNVVKAEEEEVFKSQAKAAIKLSREGNASSSAAAGDTLSSHATPTKTVAGAAVTTTSTSNSKGSKKSLPAEAEAGAPPFAPPDDWRQVLRIIKGMRRVGGAPVDTMGSEKICGEATPDAKGRRFVTLVSAMLSSQTKDPITYAATARLVKHGRGGD